MAVEWRTRLYSPQTIPVAVPLRVRLMALQGPLLGVALEWSAAVLGLVLLYLFRKRRPKAY